MAAQTTHLKDVTEFVDIDEVNRLSRDVENSFLRSVAAVMDRQTQFLFDTSSRDISSVIDCQKEKYFQRSKIFLLNTEGQFNKTRVLTRDRMDALFNIYCGVGEDMFKLTEVMAKQELLAFDAWTGDVAAQRKLAEKNFEEKISQINDRQKKSSFFTSPAERMASDVLKQSSIRQATEKKGRDFSRIEVAFESSDFEVFLDRVWAKGMEKVLKQITEPQTLLTGKPLPLGEHWLSRKVVARRQKDIESGSGPEITKNILEERMNANRKDSVSFERENKKYRIRI